MTGSTEEFWQDVYSRNIGKLIGVCCRYTRDRQLSEDLAHDAFLKAIEKSGSFEGRGSFDGWLRKIVVNHVLQHIREQKRFKNIDWSLVEGTNVQTEEPNPHAIPVQANELSEPELLNAINDLPEHHRLVFNLHVLDNFTHAHIGELLGISEGTSKSHLARARKKLKKILVDKADKEPKGRKSLFLLFLFPKKYGDKLFTKQIGNFNLTPTKKHVPKLTNVHIVPQINLHPVLTAWNFAIAAVTVGIIVSTVAVINHRQSSTGMFRTSQDPSPILSSQESEKSDTTNEPKNKSHTHRPNTATISANGIMTNKNIMNKSMKKLDSLGVALLVSSSIVFDTMAQPLTKTDTLDNRTKITADAGPPAKTRDTDDPSSTSDFKKSKRQQGTFTASSLFWSGKNNELYFNGVVRVDTNEQHFSGNGTFTFLGSVYFVVVNGSPVSINDTVKLAGEKHRLTMLNEKTAMEKYGEKGRQGAVEIDVLK